MVRSIWPPPRVQRFAITAAPSAPTPSSRYIARLGRGLFGLNLAGVIRSGTTRSGWSWRHAWTAGWASRFSRRVSDRARSEEHTSELQSPCNLVCRLLLEKKKKNDIKHVLINV